VKVASKSAQTNAEYTVLLQTIFSSNLVGVNNPGQMSHTPRFAVAPQFWLYPVLTIALMVVTVIPAVVLDRWSRKAQRAQRPLSSQP